MHYVIGLIELIFIASVCMENTDLIESTLCSIRLFKIAKCGTDSEKNEFVDFKFMITQRIKFLV